MKFGLPDGLADSLSNIFCKSSRRNELGDIWTSEEDTFGDVQTVDLTSYGQKDLTLCIRNYCEYPLIMCWADQDGNLYHYYRLDPASPTTGSSSGMVTSADRIEQTKLGHAFLFAYCNEDELDAARKSKNLVSGPVKTTFVGGYRAIRKGSTDEDDDKPIHILEIFPGIDSTRGCFGFGSKNSKKANLRGSTKVEDETTALTSAVTAPTGWTLQVSSGQVDPTPLDTTSIKYKATTLGGWPVFLHPDWEKCNNNLHNKVERDLEALCQRLPRHAMEYLSANTPLFIDLGFCYGPKALPTTGRGACFHPDVNWLLEQGMHPFKVQCVEIYDLKEHYEFSQEWGEGGLMLHEYGHAYHYKCVPGGYGNPDIMACYQAAMKEGLYDSVEYHNFGKEKKRGRAYACTDQMEYFAELSSAFLGGLDENVEFNKWFPFNRKQIKEHDPRAYEMLKRVWKVKVDD